MDEDNSKVKNVIIALLVLVLFLVLEFGAAKALRIFEGLWYLAIIGGIAAYVISERLTRHLHVRAEPEPESPPVNKPEPKSPPVTKAQPPRATGYQERGFIREMSNRAVHGRAPFAVDDAWASMTTVRQQSIDDQLRSRNKKAAQARPTAPTSPSRPQPPPACSASSELQAELARLHEICQGESMQTRSMIERRLRELDARKVPEREALREVQELFRALRLEKLADYRSNNAKGQRGTRRSP